MKTVSNCINKLKGSMISNIKVHLPIKKGIVSSNYLHMAAYFRKFHSNFKSKSTRIFKGMNPTIPKT